VTMVKMPNLGRTRQTMPLLKAVGDELDFFLRHSCGAPNGARDSASAARLVDAPRTSRYSSGPIGVALADEGKDKVPSPRR